VTAAPTTPPTAALLARTPAPGALKARILGGLVSAACLALLITGARLHPDPAGHGTHLQLGLLPCGFLAATGHPCPTCGMTTAVAWAAHGHLLKSLQTQPFGCLVAVSAATAFWAGLYILATGSRLAPLFGILLRPRSVWVAAGLLALAWAYTWLTWPA
jgi:hypothetical protein